MRTPFIGVGLRPDHYPYLEKRPQTSVSWFEAISENYMDTEGRPLKMLELIRQDYPLALHGVSLSLGAQNGLSLDYLKKLKSLIERVEPFMVSDHLCWTGLSGNNLHNLLPLVYDEENLGRVCAHLDQVQNFLGRTIAVENLSAYFSFVDSTFTEWEFMREVAARSGCKILLDINNVYVNSRNQDFDPLNYLNYIPPAMIAEVHLAGFSDMGDYLFDTHSQRVYPQVWQLFRQKIKELRDIPVLIEWDEDIPEFSELENEALTARQIWDEYHG